MSEWKDGMLTKSIIMQLNGARLARAVGAGVGIVASEPSVPDAGNTVVDISPADDGEGRFVDVDIADRTESDQRGLGECGGLMAVGYIICNASY